MKHSIVAMISIVLILSTVLLSQTASNNSSPLPNDLVDGSQTPNLVPDGTAFRLVFLSLMLPPNPDLNAITKQDAQMKRIGLSDADQIAFKQILAQFCIDYAAWRQTTAASGDPQTGAFVQTARDLVVKRLSTDGITKVVQFVAVAKTHMIVHL